MTEARLFEFSEIPAITRRWRAVETLAAAIVMLAALLPRCAARRDAH